MVLSLAVTILAAGVVYLFIPHDEDAAPEVPRVDYRVELLTARRAAAYPIVAPEGLAREWKATSVRFRGDEGDAWHLGFHAPDGEYVQIEQSTQKPKAFIDEATQGARATKATQEIAGRNWTRWTGGRYDALVLKEDGATTVVAGTGSFGQLAEMAGALKAK
ncbi:secreted protein [Streptomyces davaonensis JCM 4913]|uniref:Secreted protein n=2 Tax=Streptomyces davaonensis TaxID=348043 RepID=K4R3Q3_STRDJ|nr:secreted protein [Streptomyces davaonensis JCM 4913]